MIPGRLQRACWKLWKSLKTSGVTNYCEKTCVYCSRYRRHLRKDQFFYMDLDQIEAGLATLLPNRKSARPWPNRIGIIGGEPTIHPQFKQICQLLQRYGPREKFGLWTYGGKAFEECRSLIDQTFDFLAYNPHTEEQMKVCQHQPLTVASGEAVPDQNLRSTLIDRCWVQLTWCPSIAKDKAYFCEVGYALDNLLGLDAGWKLSPEWFMKEPKRFADQIAAYCQLCGMAVPMERAYMVQRKELVTPKLLKRMRDLGLARTSSKWVQVFKQKLDRKKVKENLAAGWDPGNYRGDLRGDRKCTVSVSV